MDFIDLKTQQSEIKEELDRRIACVLKHGQYILGPEVSELEETLSEYVGVKHCVTVASGTEALLISLMTVGVGQGDEVITTPFTFVATAEVIALLGAKPVFVDVEPHTANIDTRLIEEKITPRTKAIIPVSLYGQPADMTEINAIAARHGDIPVIEDAAQSFGATYQNKKSCGLSTIGCTSFFPSKPLGCYGDGGALFTNDDALAQAAREIRVHGQAQRYVHTRVGVGGRMDTLQCAILLAKWPRFEWEVEQRQIIGQKYTGLIMGKASGATQTFYCALPTLTSDLLQSPPGPTPLVIKEQRTSVFAQYTLLVPDREQLKLAMQRAGIPTAIHYPVPLNEQPAYKQLSSQVPMPVANWLSKHVISIPMGPDLSNKDQQQVVDIASHWSQA